MELCFSLKKQPSELLIKCFEDFMQYVFANKNLRINFEPIGNEWLYRIDAVIVGEKSLKLAGIRPIHWMYINACRVFFAGYASMFYFYNKDVPSFLPAPELLKGGHFDMAQRYMQKKCDIVRREAIQKVKDSEANSKVQPKKPKKSKKTKESIPSSESDSEAEDQSEPKV